MVNRIFASWNQIVQFLRRVGQLPHGYVGYCLASTLSAGLARGTGFTSPIERHVLPRVQSNETGARQSEGRKRSRWTASPQVI